MEITCSTSSLTPEQILAGIITQTESGEWAIRTVPVEAPEDYNTDLVRCDNSSLGLFEAFKLILGLDPNCGKLGVRTAQVEACANDVVNCNVNGMTAAQMIKKVIAYDPTTGTHAIRLAVSTVPPSED